MRATPVAIPRRTPAGGAMRPRHRGASLVEVLVAVLVLSIGLLGLANLQLTAIRNAHSAQLRSQASILAQEIIDRIRANRAAAAAYTISLADAPPAPPPPGSTTTPYLVAKKDLAEWLNRLDFALPEGDGAVSVDTSTTPATVTVTIQWDDSRGLSGSKTTWTYATQI